MRNFRFSTYTAQKTSMRVRVQIKNDPKESRQRKERFAIMQTFLIVGSFAFGYLPNTGKTTLYKLLYEKSLFYYSLKISSVYSLLHVFGLWAKSWGSKVQLQKVVVVCNVSTDMLATERMHESDLLQHCFKVKSTFNSWLVSTLFTENSRIGRVLLYSCKQYFAFIHILVNYTFNL